MGLCIRWCVPIVVAGAVARCRAVCLWIQRFRSRALQLRLITSTLVPGCWGERTGGLGRILHRGLLVIVGAEEIYPTENARLRRRGELIGRFSVDVAVGPSVDAHGINLT